MFKNNLEGLVFGKYTVLRVDESPHNGSATYWWCRCECGVIKSISGPQLVRGQERQCRRCSSLTAHLIHGESKTILHRRWRDIKKRCLCSTYKFWKDYGGRGISVCREWENSYVSFRDWALSSGYRPNLTIDRIDVNGNYCPENCRWIEMGLQQRNKRNTINITIENQTKCLKEWSDLSGLNYEKLKYKIKKGISIEHLIQDALSRRDA